MFDKLKRALKRWNDRPLFEYPEDDGVLPSRYLKTRNDLYDKVSKLRSDISDARDKAEKCKIPENLRPATPDDIVIDAVIWYPKEIDDDHGYDYWCIVDNVLRPDDLFKAYESDGCRMGLDGAYIEIKSPAAIAMSTETQSMKLYAWKPDGYGNLSFFVMAGSEEDALAAVEEKRKMYDESDSEGFGTKYYSLEVVDAGVVIVNSND